MALTPTDRLSPVLLLPLRSMDADNDGKVTAREALEGSKAALERLAATQPGPIEESNTVARVVDREHDLVLTAEELKRGREQMRLIRQVASQADPSRVLASGPNTAFSGPAHGSGWQLGDRGDVSNTLRTPFIPDGTSVPSIDEAMQNLTDTGRSILMPLTDVEFDTEFWAQMAASQDAEERAYGQARLLEQGNVRSLPFLAMLAARQTPGAQEAFEALLSSDRLEPLGKPLEDYRRVALGNPRALGELNIVETSLRALAVIPAGQPPNPSVVAAKTLAVRALARLDADIGEGDANLFLTALRTGDLRARRWALGAVTRGTSGQGRTLDRERLDAIVGNFNEAERLDLDPHALVANLVLHSIRAGLQDDGDHDLASPVALQILAELGWAEETAFLESLALGTEPGARREVAALRANASAALLAATNPADLSAVAGRLLSSLEPGVSADSVVGQRAIEAILTRGEIPGGPPRAEVLQALSHLTSQAGAAAEGSSLRGWSPILQRAVQRFQQRGGVRDAAVGNVLNEIRALADGRPETIAGLAQQIHSLPNEQQQAVLRQVLGWSTFDQSPAARSLADTLVRDAVQAASSETDVASMVAQLWGTQTTTSPPAGARVQQEARRGLIRSLMTILADPDVSPTQRAIAANVLASTGLSAADIGPEARTMGVDALAAYLTHNPQARSEALRRFQTRLSSPAAVESAGGTDELWATAFARTGDPLAREAAAMFRVTRARLLGAKLQAHLETTATAYTEEATRYELLQRNIQAGSVELTPEALTRFNAKLATLRSARSQDNMGGRAISDELVRYILDPDVAASLRDASPRMTALAVGEGVEALNQLHSRLAGVPPELASRVRLQETLRRDMVRHRALTSSNDDSASAPSIASDPEYPYLVGLLDPEHAGRYEPEDGYALQQHGGAADRWDPLKIHFLHARAAGSARANWAREASIPMIEAMGSLTRAYAGPRMALIEVDAIRRPLTRMVTEMENFGAHHTMPSRIFRGMGALAGTFETYFAFGEWKQGEMGTAEATTKMSFYANEIIYWASHTGWGHRFIRVPIETGVQEAATALLPRMSARSGVFLGARAIPVFGTLLASGSCFWDVRRAIDEGESDVAMSRGAEGIGWVLFGAGTVADATVVGAVVGVPMQVVGGVLIVGSYVYDLGFAPSDGERLAEDMGFEVR